MERCTKCGDQIKNFTITAYGDILCDQCLYDYLVTDRGAVEYMINICNGECTIAEYDADFLGHVSACWQKYRNEFALPFRDVIRIEARARELGLL